MDNAKGQKENKEVKLFTPCSHDHLLIEKFAFDDQAKLKTLGVFPIRCENCKKHIYAFDPSTLLK